nr:MAG TPA: hypothetical protein [Caudoviricetes sp.]
MTNIQFYKFWGKALEYTDRDAFVSDAALSSLWGEDDADPHGACPGTWEALGRSAHRRKGNPRTYLHDAGRVRRPSPRPAAHLAALGKG